MPVVVVGMKRLSKSIRQIQEHIGDGPKGRRRLLLRLGRAGRDATRDNITSQGGGSWKPLSRWTKAKTGRRKALITLRPRVKFRYDEDKAEVYFEESSKYWNLDTHHRGRKSRAVRGKWMRVPVPNISESLIPGGRNPMIFTKRKVSVLPARKVWASKAQMTAKTEENLRAWLRELERKVS